MTTTTPPLFTQEYPVFLEYTKYDSYINRDDSTYSNIFNDIHQYLDKIDINDKNDIKFNIYTYINNSDDDKIYGNVIKEIFDAIILYFDNIINIINTSQVKNQISILYIRIIIILYSYYIYCLIINDFWKIEIIPNKDYPNVIDYPNKNISNKHFFNNKFNIFLFNEFKKEFTITENIQRNANISIEKSNFNIILYYFTIYLNNTNYQDIKQILNNNRNEEINNIKTLSGSNINNLISIIIYNNDIKSKINTQKHRITIIINQLKEEQLRQQEQLQQQEQLREEQVEEEGESKDTLTDMHPMAKPTKRNNYSFLNNYFNDIRISENKHNTDNIIIDLTNKYIDTIYIDNNNYNIIKMITLYYYNSIKNDKLKKYANLDYEYDILARELFNNIYIIIKKCCTNIILTRIHYNGINKDTLYLYNIILFKIYLLYKSYIIYCADINKYIKSLLMNKDDKTQNFYILDNRIEQGTFIYDLIDYQKNKYNINFSSIQQFILYMVYTELNTLNILNIDLTNTQIYNLHNINYIINNYIAKIDTKILLEHIEKLKPNKIVMSNVMELLLTTVNSINGIKKQAGGNKGYKSTHKKVNIMNNKKIIERVIYIDNNKNKFIKLNKNYLQLSTFKYNKKNKYYYHK